MRFLSHILLLLALALAANSAVVCPDGISSNCYPQVFQPSKNWQVVREVQQIPAGLHVRLNLETGEQEARLLQPENDELGSEIVAVSEAKQEESSEGDLPQRFRSRKKPRASDSELLDYDLSVLEILHYNDNQDPKRLAQALDTLIELSHDIDFGLQLTAYPKIFLSMQNIAEHHGDTDDVAEKIYRVMGASLRNNPDAVKQFARHHQHGLIPELYRSLTKELTSVLVQKRILGIIHALSMDPQYALENFNLSDVKLSEGLSGLISVFPELKDSAKARLVIILEDLGFISRDTSDAEIGADETFSNFIQSLLYLRRLTEEHQFQTVFKALAKLHEPGELPVSGDFLHWLSEEVEERKEGMKRRDKSSSAPDSDFHSFLSVARHTIFGNPNAARKAFDEL